MGEPWRRTLALAGRTLEVATPVPGLRADTSPDVAHEVLSVLLSNAYEHGAGTVTMTARRGPSGSIAIDVADEGEGLPEVPGTLFERRAGEGNGGARHRPRPGPFTGGGRGRQACAFAGLSADIHPAPRGGREPRIVTA